MPCDHCERYRSACQPFRSFCFAWRCSANPALVQERHQRVASLQPLKLDLGDDDDDAAGEDTDEGDEG